MNALQKEYSFVELTNLLCVWHIEKNIVAKTKRVFQTNDSFRDFVKQWKLMMYSVDEHSFAKEMERLELNEPIEAVDYIKINWLPFKEKFVVAWTKRCKHFGMMATSRVEGMHLSLKS